MQKSIALTNVSSSQISAVGHDPATNTLAVQFKAKSGAGSIYHYANVSPEQHVKFMTAESIGSHFGKHFKSNAAHPFTKVS